MRHTLFLIALAVAASCSAPHKKTAETQDTTNKAIGKQSPRPEDGSSIMDRMEWARPLITRYIATSTNPQVIAARNDSTVSWLWDDIVHTDTADYIAIHVGHDAVDDDGSSPRYVTDAWLYIDTITHRAYEYHVAEDSLVALP